MKNFKLTLAVFALVLITVLAGCASSGPAAPSAPPPPVTRILELDNKGNALGITQTPEWITTYVMSGISAVETMYKDKYCIIGEESGVNRQFVLAWADNFSAQQRIGAMLRTNIASNYQAHVNGMAQSSGGAASALEASSDYNQEIDSIINAVVNVSYSGAQRENDWWTLRRRYDPDNEGVYTDEYTAYVLYTFPRAELNRQIAYALESSVSADSALYDITIQMAQTLLQGGIADWIDADNAASQPVNTTTTQPAAPAGATGNVTIRNNSSNTGSVMTLLRIYKDFEAIGEPFMVYSEPVLGGEEVSLNLPRGTYTFEAFLNNSTESLRAGLVNSGGVSTVSVNAGGIFTADFYNGNLSSFSRR